MTQPSHAPMSEATPNPPARNAAVLRCRAARERSLEDSRAKKVERFDAKELADAAYLHAMPDLSGYENIRDFIACVTHGIIADIVHPVEGPKLLYAAQVALGALRHEPKEPKAAALKAAA